MPWYKPWTWLTPTSPTGEVGDGALLAEPVLGPGKIDHVFGRYTRYHVSSKEADHFEGHPEGEGSDWFVIIRCRDGGLPEQYEEVEEEQEDQRCTPQGHLPTALMRLLKGDMHIRRYNPIWGRAGEGEPLVHWSRRANLDGRAVGLISDCVVEAGQARMTVQLYMPKGQKRDTHFTQNLRKALTFNPNVDTPDLVHRLSVELADELEDYDREGLSFTLTADLRVEGRKKEMPAAWRGKRKVGKRQRCLKLKQSFIDALDASHRVGTSTLRNIYEYTWEEMADAFDVGSDSDFDFEVKLRDTHQNAVHTVGTLYTHATIGAAIGVAASGDIIEVHETAGNTYAESPNTGALDGLQIISVVPDHAIRIDGAVTLATGGSTLENFTVNPTAALATVVALANSCAVVNCVVVGGTVNGIALNGVNGLVLNTVIYDSARGVNFIGFVNTAKHCTAVDCTVAGFSCSVGLARVYCFACLGSTNAVDFANPDITGCAWNASGDLTAPGPAGQTGFLNTDFVGYAADDFRLQAGVKATTQARFDGWPQAASDAFYARRSRTLTGASVFFAGFHHPITIPTGLAATNPTTDGDLDITWTNAADYTDDEYLHVYDGNSGALLGVLEADLGAGRITGLTNGTLYTLIGRVSAEGLVFSDESNIAAAMPLAGGGPPHIRVFDRTMVDMQG